MAKSAHTDKFAAENLPPGAAWPEMRFDLPELAYPERLNCVTELLDSHVREGRGGAPCFIGESGETFTYADVRARVNRIANVLTKEYGLVPGNRVLLRSANNPMMAMVYLAVLKAGGIAVATMPLLRARELTYIINKAEIALALCDHRLGEDLRLAQSLAPRLKRIAWFNTDETSSLNARMAHASGGFAACDTAAEDICLIAFTSGTTGEPKGTMHNHRDMLAVCDTFGKHILRAGREDRFIGSPPLAFTFGLGGLVLFPMRIGASTVLIERAPPDVLLEAFGRYGATVCFTAPTAYRAMLAKHRKEFTQGLRLCVSAGEALPVSSSSTGSAPLKCCMFLSPRKRKKSARARPARPSPVMKRRCLTRRAGNSRAGSPVFSRCAGPPAAATSRTIARASMSGTAGITPATLT